MKKYLTVTTATVLALSVAAPAFARLNSSNVPRLSRRLIESEAILNQRVPYGAMPVDLLLRERRQAVQDATGRADLSRSQITTRIRTIRGGTAEVRQHWRVGRPSRRSIIEKVEESMLELPPALVETGGDSTLTVSRATRRTIIELAREANGVKRP